MLFSVFQSEIREWQLKNFPNATTNEPFHGIVEELGEITAARVARRHAIEDMSDPAEAVADYKDGIADMTVFAADYCNRNGIKIYSIINDCFGISSGSFEDFQVEMGLMVDHFGGSPYDWLVIQIGNLAHARLKSAQGIRGAAEQHERSERIALAEIFGSLAILCDRASFDYDAVITEVWGKVKQRDWTACKVTGRTVDGSLVYEAPTLAEEKKLFDELSTRSKMPYES